jgi:antirestriction protein ArdC
MPARSRFVDAPHYYSTLFHELVHSTGHASRLNRTFGARFGDEHYSKEELVAEMGAAFLCAIAEIANEHTKRNTTAYIQSWISRLVEDNRLIVHAAVNAQRAVDCIIGSTFVEESETTENVGGCRCDDYRSGDLRPCLSLSSGAMPYPALRYFRGRDSARSVVRAKSQ